MTRLVVLSILAQVPLFGALGLCFFRFHDILGGWFGFGNVLELIGTLSPEVGKLS